MKENILVPLVGFPLHPNSMQLLIHSVKSFLVVTVVHNDPYFLKMSPCPSTLAVFTILAECLIEITCTNFGFPTVLSLAHYIIAGMCSCSLKTAVPFCISLSCE